MKFKLNLISALFFITPAQAFEGGSVGLSTTWDKRQDYGEKSFYRFKPEIFAQTYLSLAPSLFLRPGIRLSYAWQQPEMPKSLRLEERDFAASLETGLVYEWYIVPSLTFGGGLNWRKTQLKTSEPIDSSESQMSASERLYFGYLQVGLGVPLFDGVLVLEPIARFHRIELDKRSWFTFGLETSFGWN